MTERRVRLPWKDFNRKFRPLLLEEDHRYLVLCGGAGSGKSFFAAQRFLYRLLAKPLCDLLVVRAAANTHRDSTYALFRQVIRQWGLEDLFTCRETEPRILCANGNSVVFRGLGDREQLKSSPFPRGADGRVGGGGLPDPGGGLQPAGRAPAGREEPQADGAHLQPGQRRPLAEAQVLRPGGPPGPGAALHLPGQRLSGPGLRRHPGELQGHRPLLLRGVLPGGVGRAGPELL